MRFLILLFFGLMIVSSRAVETEIPPTIWIWKTATPGEQERVFFRREFQLPANIASAIVTVACDNWQRLFVNGHDLGMGNDWQSPRSYDVTRMLKPDSRNVIALEARNKGGAAGMALRFRATLKDGKKLHVVSDENWQCVSEVPKGWQNLDFKPTGWSKAVNVGKMGASPWGEIMPTGTTDTETAIDKTSEYHVAPGFKLEQLYQVPAEQGSWVSVTVNGKGQLLCSDQYGAIYQVTLATGPDASPIVEKTAIPLHGAHGLLWNDGILWVSVNEDTDQSGVWKVPDATPDKPELVKAFKGRGEHGPHSLTLSPDGKFIYVVSGNHTDLPDMEKSLPVRSWAEDQLLPRRPDANGHARTRMAPGGWVARFTPDGKNWELFANGFRNDFDICFNDRGDLFGYDSDMEWDMGMPWYRPTRICHIVPGAEFGWRNGTGKWPSYYEDSMPPLLDIGPGSPTGMVSGKGAHFPEKYQRAIFGLDWTFATIYAIHLSPDGPGYKAVRENFISGSGLPLTDVTIGHDGAMYFLTGGRRTGSNLWRVTYTGTEPTTPIPYQTKDLALIDQSAAMASLGSENRIARFNARVSLEQQGPASFAPILADHAAKSWETIEAVIGTARTGSAANKAEMLAALDQIAWDSLDKPQKLGWLRAAGLVFARYGPPDEASRAKVLAKIDSSFPAEDDTMNRELCRMLCYLQAPEVVSRTLALMDSAGPTPAPDWLEIADRNARYGKDVKEMIANLPPAQIIHYIYCLRVVKGPWKEGERVRFFSWFNKLMLKKGGHSYDGFIIDLKKQALATCTPVELERLKGMDQNRPDSPLANLPEIKGPGHTWTIDEVVKLADTGLAGRSKENGKRMFEGGLCAACHRFGSEGGNIGPDLTNLSGRFKVRDVAEAIIDPSKTISTQYTADLITYKDGKQITGRILDEKDDKWIIATSPFDPSQTTEVERNEIKDMKPSPVSQMPPGLINRLNPDELKDLLAYLLAK